MRSDTDLEAILAALDELIEDPYIEPLWHAARTPRPVLLRCPECGGWYDMSDLGALLLHVDARHERPSCVPRGDPSLRSG